MKTNWDYSKLAEAYLKRPNYSESAIDKILKISKLKNDSKICDVGAGVGHLTLMFLKRNFNVIAIEPNNEMRKRGMLRTRNFRGIKWVEATGEDTKQKKGTFDLVSFGSSFNVTERDKALNEAYRILKDEGWFVCMWNHRDIRDKIQSNIEKIIKKNIPQYNYGTRREDQTIIINESKLYGKVCKIQGKIIHVQQIEDLIEAWKSHATLKRQAKKNFRSIINQIQQYIKSLNVDEIKVPYTTNIWIAQKRIA